MNILRRLWDLVVTAWNLLCGTGLEANFQTRRFINTCLIILAINITLFIAGFTLGWSGPVIISAFTSSILVLIGWKASELAVKIISSLGGAVPVAGAAIKPAIEELKKLLPPLVTISLFLAFTASIVAIKGVGYFTYSDLLIWATVILFTAIFAVYIGSKVKIAGWVMIGFLYYLLIGNYFWPIQVQGTLDWVERKTVKRAVVAGDATKDYELVAIANNTPLYSFSFGEFKKEKITTQTEVVAKIIGRKDDPASEEPMYKVILPLAENLYVGGEIIYVPARLTKLVQKVAPPPGPATDKHLRVYGEGEHRFFLSQSEETGWIKIPQCMYWELSSTKKGEFDLIKYGGKVISYSKEQEQYIDFPEQDILFKIHAKEHLGFILRVRPKV